MAPLTRSMTLVDTAACLYNQMTRLTNGYRIAIPRYQTMHSALVWSHQLLGRDEQQVLAMASVFADGWTLDAAQSVCMDTASVFHRLPSVLSTMN